MAMDNGSLTKRAVVEMKSSKRLTIVGIFGIKVLDLLSGLHISKSLSISTRYGLVGFKR
jgi:hypothetical protein